MLVVVISKSCFHYRPYVFVCRTPTFHLFSISRFFKNDGL